MLAKFTASLGLLLLGLGCSTSPELYPEHELVDKLLKPRAGFQGKLTNLVCLAKSPDGKCTEEKIITYDLADEEFRETTNRLNFLCKVGSKRYKICTDKEGFCRFSYKKSCFILGWPCSRGERLEEFLPVTQYRYLLDARTRCGSRDKYDLWWEPGAIQ